MAGPSKCLKVFLVIINLAFLIVGLAVLGVGIYLRTNANLSQFSEVFAGMELFRSVPAIGWILIGCGSFIALVVLCALVGVCRESKCLVILYLVLLAVILIFNVAALILTAVTKGPVTAFIAKQLSDTLMEHYNGTGSGDRMFTDSINRLQRNEECCGWTGLGNGNIFTQTPWFRQQLNRTSKPQLYPDSCCVSDIAQIRDDDYEERRMHELCVRTMNETVARSGHDRVMHPDDCYDKLTAAKGVITQAVFGAVISAIVLQVVCIACSLVMVIQISNGYSRGHVV